MEAMFAQQLRDTAVVFRSAGRLFVVGIFFVRRGGTRAPAGVC